VRHTQLEQTKHCLVLLKKACRAQTAVSWKQLRQAMEQELAERLAQQQTDLAEQLAFVQVRSASKHTMLVNLAAYAHHEQHPFICL
jgi:hypothetical protein